MPALSYSVRIAVVEDGGKEKKRKTNLAIKLPSVT
jgi:hypothetical protein